MTTVKLNNALKASPLGRLLGLLFFCLIQISFAQSNDIKQVYDLNDPRNPDCPCHKYQKMADDEFKKISKESKLNQLEEANVKKDIQNLLVQKKQFEKIERPPGSSHSDAAKKQKRKKIKGRMHKYLNFFALKPNKTKKIKPCYSVCFKW